MNNSIISEDESLTNKELHLDFTNTLEHPEKVSRYLQFSPIDKETFRVREIEVEFNEEKYCNEIVTLLEDTVSFSRMTYLQIPYLLNISK